MSCALSNGSSLEKFRSVVLYVNLLVLSSNRCMIPKYSYSLVPYSGNGGSLVLRACPLLLRDLGVAAMGFGGFS